MLLAAAAAAAALGGAGAQQQDAERRSYVATVAGPNIHARIQTFMSFPQETISFSLPMSSLGFLDLGSDAAVQEWLYNQVVATGVGAADCAAAAGSGCSDELAAVTRSAMDMLYLGFEDGRFISYSGVAGPSAYSFRAAGAAPAAGADWSPFTLEGLAAACGAICGAGGDARPCEACLFDKCDHCDERHGLLGEQLRAGGGEGFRLTAALEDIRSYYTLTVVGAELDQHGGLSQWSLYDHRARPWYTKQRERWRAASSNDTGWSDIYSCHGSRKYCITATGAAVLPDGSFAGVFGADYDLDLLGSVLAEALDGIDGGWAYVVERGTGSLLASTLGGERQINRPATRSRSQPVRESAQMLQPAGWPAERRVSSMVAAAGWEAHTVSLADSRGLDWLIVTGQSMNCTSKQIWSFGRCSDCAAGKASVDGVCSRCPRSGDVPNSEGVCAPCPAGSTADERQVDCASCAAGRYSASSDALCEKCASSRMVPDGLRASCECAAGYYNDTAARWLCFDMDFSAELAGEMAREQSDAQTPCAVCPPCAVCDGGSAPPRLQSGYIAIPTPDAREVRAFRCAADDTASIGCPGGAVPNCTMGHEGLTCQRCRPNWHKSSDACAECDDASLSSATWTLVIVIVLVAGYSQGKHKLQDYLVRKLEELRASDEAADADTQTTENPVAGASVGSTTSRRRGRTRAGSVVQDFSARTLSGVVNVDGERIMGVALRSCFTPIRTAITYVQVTAQIGKVLHIQLPAGYMRDVVDSLKPLLTIWELVISAECRGLGGFALKWIGKVIGFPLILFLLILARYKMDRKRGVEAPEAVTNAKQHVFFAVFFVYPTICNVLFASWNCRKIGPDQTLLLDDDRIFCENDSHDMLQAISLVLIVAFAFGTPVVLVFVLRNRRAQYKAQADQHEGLVIAVEQELKLTRDKAEVITRDVTQGEEFSFLLQSYKPRYHWWECCDLLRKLVLVGLVLLVGKGTTLQVLVAVFFSAAFLVLHIKTWPFKDDADNCFRAASEVHVFITFVVCLALKGERERGGEDSGSYYDWYVFCTFVLLLPGGFLATIAFKLRAAWELEREDGEKHPERHSAERMLRGLGDESDTERLRSMVKKLKKRIEDQEKTKRLGPVEHRLVAFACEHCELPPVNADDATALIRRIGEIASHLGLDVDLKTANPKEVVAEIHDAIVETSERHDGVFLSHYQMYGPDVMSLKAELVAAGMDGQRIWYDKDNDPSPEAMRMGVRDSRYFLLYLTEGVLQRKFCRFEIHWALHYRKEIVLCWKQEGSGSVASFARFFDDCAKELKEGDDSHEGLTDVLSTAAIPYYLTGEFHSASMSELLRRLGHADGGDADTAYEFTAQVPRLFLGFSAANGLSQSRVVRSELTSMAPALTQIMDLSSGETPTLGDVVIVYLTEGLFDDSTLLTQIKQLLQTQQRASDAAKRWRRKKSKATGGTESVPVIWVAETDMRHGWTQYQAKQAKPDDHTWRDGLRELQLQIPSADVAWISPQFLEGAIPFYKDKTFRRRSVECILAKMGAQPSAAEPPLGDDIGRAASAPAVPAGARVAVTDTRTTSVSFGGVEESTLTRQKASSEPEPEPEPEAGSDV